jgi:hypothetical protein
LWTECAVCGEVLANNSLNARNLQRHLTKDMYLYWKEATRIL